MYFRNCNAWSYARKKYSAVTSNAKFLIKLIGLEVRMKNFDIVLPKIISLH
tara:strand:- start:710 stop:862 length:153 start_codon:yes stop_codon:yes gene_type:complete